MDIGEFGDYDDVELDEFEEINQSDASSTFLDKRWFRWTAIGVAALVVLSFSLPVLSPFFNNSTTSRADTSDAPSVPDFVLPTSEGSDLRLRDRASSYSTTILVFHRGYECTACRVQLAAFQSGYNDLRIEGAELLAVGIDNQLNTQRLAQQAGLRFPMLYDESGTVASNYGIRDQLESELTTAIFILDQDLNLILNPVGTTSDQVLPVQELLNAIRQANGTAGRSGVSG